MKALKAVPELFVNRFAQEKCVCEKGERACDAMMLGSLMLAMKGVGLVPGLSDDHVLRFSPESMWQKLNEAEFFPSYSRRPSSRGWALVAHEKCDMKDEWRSSLLAVKKAWPTASDLAFRQFGK